MGSLVPAPYPVDVGMMHPVALGTDTFHSMVDLDSHVELVTRIAFFVGSYRVIIFPGMYG